MIVMPLGPDLVDSIQFPAHEMGYLAGGATFASALLGFILAKYLDKTSRKKALLSLMIPRSLFLFICGFATNPTQLLVLYVISGSFSGAISGTTLAATIDLSPPKERGSAMAFVNSAFSISAIAMIPITLEITRLLSWEAAFFIFGGLGVLLALIFFIYFPEETTKVNRKGSEKVNPFKDKTYVIMLTSLSLIFFGHFLIVPNIANFFIFNLDIPREYLSVLYAAGGILSLVSLKVGSKYFDKGYEKSTYIFSSLVLLVSLFLCYIFPLASFIIVPFSLFMAMSSLRNNLTLTLISKLPTPQQRAQYMTYAGTTRHIATGTATVFASLYLASNQSGKIFGLQDLGYINAICIVGVMTIVAFYVIPKQSQKNLVAKGSAS